MAKRCERIIVVEFDAPDMRLPMRFETQLRVVRAYENGLREYPDPRGVVTQGFLMPVLLGYWMADAEAPVARTNWEQPISQWLVELRAAGYAHVEATHVREYWWADAWRLVAHR